MDERSPSVLDKFSKQIAFVVYNSSYYEDALAETIKVVLGLNALQTNALVRPMGARAKLDLLCRLSGASDISGDEKKIISKHSEAAKKAFEDRNAIIHGQFGHNQSHEVVVRSYGGKEKLTGTPKRWSLQMISTIATTFSDHGRELERVCSPLAKAGPLSENLVDPNHKGG